MTRFTYFDNYYYVVYLMENCEDDTKSLITVAEVMGERERGREGEREKEGGGVDHN